MHQYKVVDKKLRNTNNTLSRINIEKKSFQ